MPTAENKLNPGRSSTDESLQAERTRTELELESHFTALDEAMDRAITNARASADREIARARAHPTHAAAPKNGDVVKAVRAERADQDCAIDAERRAVDDAIRRDRTSEAPPLVSARAQTDRDLSHERGESDEAVLFRDMFLGIVSHDLRNMLNVVLGYASLISKGVSPSMSSSQMMAFGVRIQRACGRMDRMVGDLLDVASIEAGALALHPEPGDLAAVLEEVVEGLQAEAASKGISLTTEARQPLPTIPFDHARVVQVLTNIAGNSIKFTDPGGSILLRLARVADDVVVTVRDTGAGIPPEKLVSVFERYVKGAVNGRGVGLGLFIARGIVQGHGGRIWVESEVGEGSSFYFAMPIGAR